MAAMTIAGLARECGVGVETIRYYQRRGLLGTPPKAGGSGGIRRYGAADRQRLRFIRAAQTAGFTLDQVGELLALEATEDRARARSLAEQQLQVLDDRIAGLMATRDALRHLARQCGTGAAGPCPIIEAFAGPDR